MRLCTYRIWGGSEEMGGGGCGEVLKSGVSGVSVASHRIAWNESPLLPRSPFIIMQAGKQAGLALPRVSRFDQS